MGSAFCSVYVLFFFIQTADDILSVGLNLTLCCLFISQPYAQIMCSCYKRLLVDVSHSCTLFPFLYIFAKRGTTRQSHQVDLSFFLFYVAECKCTLCSNHSWRQRKLAEQAPISGRKIRQDITIYPLTSLQKEETMAFVVVPKVYTFTVPL